MERKTKDYKFNVKVKSLLINQKGKILILKDTKKDSWIFPSGSLEFGENVYNAMWRIIKKQTNLDSEIIKPCNVWSERFNEYTHNVGITFHCIWDWDKYIDENYQEDETPKKNHDPVSLSDEFNDYRWVSAREIMNSHYPISMKEEVKTWMNFNKE